MENETEHKLDEQTILGMIPKWHTELKQILPDLPSKYEVEITHNDIRPESGTGGTAHTSTSLELSYDSAFKDTTSQIRSLKGAYFHEAYHALRGFTRDSEVVLRPIDRAAEEGLAVVFERDFAESQTTSGDYSRIDDIQSWVDTILKLSPEEFKANWEKYVLFDEESDRKTMIYCVGRYLVDRALKSSKGLSAVDLLKYDTNSILKLADIT